jgi:uncharacterized protein (DUF58 family)
MIPTTLLDADAVSHGEALGLLARKIVEGYRVGEHRSPLQGFAIEFAQHREYVPGDDTRHLDWKVLGRSDRYYIKQYDQDTNFVAQLVVDVSTSMNYASGPVSKLQYAKALAACLAYVILIQRDAVALSLFDSTQREHIPRTDNLGRIQHIMQRLAAFEPSGGTRLGPALEQVARRAKGRGLVLLLSDLFDDESELNRALQRLSFAGQEVIVFHTLDHDELTFPFQGTWKFHDLEGAAVVQIAPADIRSAYLKKFDAYRERVRRICEKFNVHYVLADTSRSLAETLSGYLAFRRMRGWK